MWNFASTNFSKWSVYVWNYLLLCLHLNNHWIIIYFYIFILERLISCHLGSCIFNSIFHVFLITCGSGAIMFWQISLVVFLFVIYLYLFLLQMREGTYRIFLYPNPTQEKTLSDLLEGRRLMAKLTDFESFAQRTLIGTITETPGIVFPFFISFII